MRLILDSVVENCVHTGASGKNGTAVHSPVVEVIVEDHVAACTVRVVSAEKTMHLKTSPAMTTLVPNGQIGVAFPRVLYHAVRARRLVTEVVTVELVQDLRQTRLLVMQAPVRFGRSGETSQAVQ